MALKLLHIATLVNRAETLMTFIMKMYHSMFLNILRDRQATICSFCFPRDSSLQPPRLYPNTPCPNFCYFCCVCFSPTPSLIFSPFPFLPCFDLAGVCSLSPSIANEGSLLLLLSQNDQSHPVFCNLQCLLILLSYFCHWWLFCTSVFLHSLFQTRKVPVVEGRGGRSQ